jgi:hypothetical protein
MSDFENSGDSELRELRMEATVLYQGVQIRLLEGVLKALCENTGATFDGKNLSEYLDEARDRAFRDLLRTLSDTHPRHASDLSQLFESMKRGDSH